MDAFLPPEDAFQVMASPYLYYIWATMRELLPEVKMHIIYEGDIDDPCACTISFLDEVTTIVIYGYLDRARAIALELPKGRGWTVAGEPLYTTTCTHDYDPRS